MSFVHFLGKLAIKRLERSGILYAMLPRGKPLRKARKAKRGEKIVRFGICLLFVALAGCVAVEKVPPFGEIKSVRQIPEHLVVPPTATLDEGKTSWVRETSGLLMGEIFLRAPFRGDEVASFYLTHMTIARWFPRGRPEKTPRGWQLAFVRGLDKCRIIVEALGPPTRVRIEVNLPSFKE